MYKSAHILWKGRLDDSNKHKFEGHLKNFMDNLPINAEIHTVEHSVALIGDHTLLSAVIVYVIPDK